ncbi:hypothetical protein OQA88_9269 [Cercophora sp. LCS_1]
MASKDFREPEVRFFSQMPPGYVFVQKGDIYVTRNCRQKTHQAGKTLYVVVNKHNKPIGLRCPKWIYEAVGRESQATASKRAAAVQRRDTAIQDKFEDALTRLFPKAPKECIPEILKQSLEKRSGRVGRTGTIELEEKVRLAARAHIRHCHTDYDKLLKAGEGRDSARRSVWDELNNVARAWGGQPTPHHILKKMASTKTAKGEPSDRGRGIPSAGRAKPNSVARRATVVPGHRMQTRQMAKMASLASGKTADDAIEIIDSEDDVFSLSEDSDDSEVGLHSSEWSSLDD